MSGIQCTTGSQYTTWAFATAYSAALSWLSRIRKATSVLPVALARLLATKWVAPRAVQLLGALTSNSNVWILASSVALHINKPAFSAPRYQKQKSPR